MDWVSVAIIVTKLSVLPSLDLGTQSFIRGGNLTKGSETANRILYAMTSHDPIVPVPSSDATVTWVVKTKVSSAYARNAPMNTILDGILTLQMVQALDGTCLALK